MSRTPRFKASETDITQVSPVRLYVPIPFKGIGYPLLSITVFVSKSNTRSIGSSLFCTKSFCIPESFSHCATSSLVDVDEKRLPSSHVTLPSVNACKFVALEPIPLLWEVQTGTMVLPLKS